MLARITITSLAMLLAIIVTVPVQAQVSLTDLKFQNKPLEPGGGVAMVQSSSAQAALGDGSIVFKFKITDIDPIADDASDVTITCILIQNLGTATIADIAEVMVLDQDGNSVTVAAAPTAIGVVPAGGCANMATTGANAQIQFENFFDLTAGPAGFTTFVLPDDGMEIFQVAVRTKSSADLADDSQNHTIMLQVTFQLTETVGSPPAATIFVAPTVMDSAPEVVWNGGVNSFTEDTWVVNPLMPGETGTVGRFTVCDNDSNAHQLIIDRIAVKQSEGGTANSSDIVSLDLYRVEGFTRTLVASRVPDAAFDRGSGAAGGLLIPGGAPTAITVPDDTCLTFELDAHISPFAFKGHTIKPRFQISTQEPATALIDQSADPEILIAQATLIGKGLLVFPDTKLIGKPGLLPLQIVGVALPGLGTLQVGPNGKLQYDPRVINIKEINGAGPYIVSATEIDNRRGEARFTVQIDPNFDGNGDGTPDNPLLTAFQDGTIANLVIVPTGKPGSRTRLVLTFDCFELVDQNNCIPQGFPNLNVPNQNPNNDISVSAGEVKILHPGDVDLDGIPTIRDSLLLANDILLCTFTPTQTGSVQVDPTQTASIQFNLTDEQRSVGDVAAPFAATGIVPGCAELTSADVAEIARLAINFGTTPAPVALAASVATIQTDRPWYSFLVDAWNWATGTTQSGFDLVQVDMNFNAAAQSFDVGFNDVPGAALGGIQGRVYFDPTTMQVQNVNGINGYNVLAARVDNALGEVRFVVLAPKGQGKYAGNILRLSVTVTGQTLAPTLSVAAFIDEDALDIPFTMIQERGFATSPVALSLSGVQALSQGNGGYHFQVQGTGIAGIQVQVYDLAGGKLFDQETAGNTLSFQPLTTTGQPFANGVYLYVITAKGFQGERIRSDVNKLAILR